MAKAESSKAAAGKGARVDPNAAGGANYELPWYAAQFLLSVSN
jgi:replication factor C subunit 2/4